MDACVVVGSKLLDDAFSHLQACMNTTQLSKHFGSAHVQLLILPSSTAECSSSCSDAWHTTRCAFRVGHVIQHSQEAYREGRLLRDSKAACLCAQAQAWLSQQMRWILPAHAQHAGGQIGTCTYICSSGRCILISDLATRGPVKGHSKEVAATRCTRPSADHWLWQG